MFRETFSLRDSGAMIKTLARLLKAFGRESSGNIAITFGIAVLPISLSVGAAVDYSLASRTKTVLNEFADAAALSAVSQAAMALSADKAQTNAVNFFKGQAATLKRGSVSDVSVTVTDNGALRTAVLSYTANVPTAFMGLASINNLAVSGTSTAASARRPT
jgi:Flp pilus assembly protein TadG